MAKTRLGFSSELADTCKAVGWRQGENCRKWPLWLHSRIWEQEEAWTKATGGAPGMLGNLLSTPYLALGAPSAVPPPDGCPGFISESLIGQHGEKVNPLDLAS